MSSNEKPFYRKVREDSVVVQFEIKKEASQTRDYSAAKNAALRAARSDPSLRKRGSLGMTTFTLSHY
jgi:hypothetical protein